MGKKRKKPGMSWWQKAEPYFQGVPSRVQMAFLMAYFGGHAGDAAAGAAPPAPLVEPTPMPQLEYTSPGQLNIPTGTEKLSIQGTVSPKQVFPSVPEGNVESFPQLPQQTVPTTFQTKMNLGYPETLQQATAPIARPSLINPFAGIERQLRTPGALPSVRRQPSLMPPTTGYPPPLRRF